jgi:hypothetical protein
MLGGIVMYYLMAGLFYQILPIVEDLQNFDGFGGVSQVFNNPNSYLLIIVFVYGCFYVEPLVGVVWRLRKMWRGQESIVEEHELHRSEISEPLDIEENDRAKVRRSMIEYGRRHTGFAFSGEAGHALEVTDPNFFEKQEIVTVEESADE